MSGWNSTLTRKTPMKRGAWQRQDARQSPSAPRKAPIRRLGKKGQEWAAAWRELKPKFERAGITRCELGMQGCTPGEFLTPMHSLKRRNITTPEELREVIIACQNCHAIGELMKEPDMELLVQRTIANRVVAIVSPTTR